MASPRTSRRRCTPRPTCLSGSSTRWSQAGHLKTKHVKKGKKDQQQIADVVHAAGVKDLKRVNGRTYEMNKEVVL